MVARVLFAAFAALTFSCLLPSDKAQAASFECATATQPLEKLICADAELSKLDEEMATAYSESLRPYSAEAQTELRRSQRSWLKFVRTYCGYWLQQPTASEAEALNCMKQEYENRLPTLISTHPTEPYHFYNIKRFEAVAMLEDSDAGKKGELVRHELNYPQIDTPATAGEKAWNESIATRALAELDDAGLEEADTADFQTGYRVLVALPRLISYESFTYYTFRGWGQPRSDTRIYNVSVETGEALNAEDIFDMTTPWQRGIAEHAIQKLMEDSGREMTVDALAQIVGDPLIWEISKDTLTVRPDFYVMPGGWNGSGSAAIPWRELKPYLRSDLPAVLNLE